jgi:hypothetical protein
MNKKYCNMIGRTKDGEAVWSRGEGEGRPFLIVDEGTKESPLVWRWWWCWWTFKRLPKPHLSYAQVSNAAARSTKLLKEWRKGPIYEKRGFLYNRANKVIATRAITKVVLHWMEGCGFVFTRKKLIGGRVEIDIDAEATRKNRVV